MKFEIHFNILFLIAIHISIKKQFYLCITSENAVKNMDQYKNFEYLFESSHYEIIQPILFLNILLNDKSFNTTKSIKHTYTNTLSHI